MEITTSWEYGWFATLQLLVFGGEYVLLKLGDFYVEVWGGGGWLGWFLWGGGVDGGLFERWWGIFRRAYLTMYGRICLHFSIPTRTNSWIDISIKLSIINRLNFNPLITLILQYIPQLLPIPNFLHIPPNRHIKLTTLLNLRNCRHINLMSGIVMTVSFCYWADCPWKWRSCREDGGYW